MADPLVSVVLPVRNGASTIEAQLRALASQQSCPVWELVVSDNGSTDETISIVRRIQPLLGVKVNIVDSSNRPGASHARNVGVLSARGGLILTCDADDVVGDRWIAAMSSALSDADMVGGSIDHALLNSQLPGDPHRGGWSESLENPWDFLPFASGANTGFRREVFEAIDGWDPAFTIGQDVDFSWRAQLAGFALVFEPSAVVAYRHREGLVANCRQAYRYGRAVPQLYRRFRSAGMSRQPSLRFVKVPVWLVLHVFELVRDSQREHWVVAASVWCGRLVGSIRNRVWYP